MVVWDNPERCTLPGVVVFPGFFFNWMGLLMAATFSRVVAVSTSQVLYDLVKAERPDFVLTGSAGVS